MQAYCIHIATRRAHVRKYPTISSVNPRVQAFAIIKAERGGRGRARLAGRWIGALSSVSLRQSAVYQRIYSWGLLDIYAYVVSGGEGLHHATQMQSHVNGDA